ncbi:MAG: oxidoreductase [Deltaproteobacteria bacterium]|nr:oxidoreductase [Deltaproteobacteria bacterium]
MTESLFSAGGFLVPLLVGMALMLYGAAKSVQQRNNPRSLILWGALHDAGIFCLGLGASGGINSTGLWLFVLFQAAARLLALTALKRLTPPVLGAPVQLQDLCATAKRQPWTAACFGLGMLAAVGGSPFLVPEARMFISAGVLGSMPGAMAALLCMALATTVLIWLHVEAVRIAVLDTTMEESSSSWTAPAGNVFLMLGLAVVVALFGVFRGPITGLLATAYNVAVPHSAAHPAYWCYYLGAFATGAAFLVKFDRAPLVGVAAAALALFATLAAEAAPTAKLFLIMVSVVALVVSVYSLSYIHERHGRYWFFLLLTFASLAGIVSSGDSASMYGYWELMTFASYFLVVHENNRSAYDAGLKYYVMCAGGALFMLPGLLLLGDPALSAGLVQGAFVLCLAGFAVKMGLVPVHSWLPDAHPAAPSSVSGPLSGIITKMGVFGIVAVLLMRPMIVGMPGLFGLSWLGTGLVAMGAATLVYGEIMALRQDDIKRMLAYSTLGQIGEIALVLGIGTWLSTTGALWHMLNHAIMKDLLFLGAGALIMRAGSRKLADLRGLGRQMPVTAACMGIGLVSIMGLPPFGAFYSKFMMIQAATAAGHLWLAALILGGSLVGLIYYTRILKTLVFEERPADLPAVTEVPRSMQIGMAVLAAICVIMGLAPQLAMNLVVPVASLCFTPNLTDPDVLVAMKVSWPIFVVVPVFGAVIPAIYYRDRKKAGWASVGVLLFTALLVVLFGRDLDTLSFCFALLVPVLGAVNMAYALGYMEHSHRQWRFYCAFTAMCGGLVGMAASQYMLSFFLFWEIMSSWTLYLAIAHEGDKDSLREAFKYFIFNVFGAGFIFLGMCIVGPFTPFNATLLKGAAPYMPHGAAWLGMALLAIGFLMKAAQLPFRIDWQMHPGLAPTPVSGYISSVLLKSAILGLIKLFMLMGGGFMLAGVLGGVEQNIISTFAMWVGGITIIMAALQALRTNVIKLVFIYSTVSQLGYMVLAVAAGGALGYAGGMLHVINHVFFKDLLFLVCGAVMFATHRETLDDLGGIGRQMPFTLTMFAIAGLSVVGVPPTSGFSSKWLIYHALMEAGQPFLALLSLIGSVLTMAYIAKFLHAAFLGQPSPNLHDVHEAPLIMRAPMGILAAGCVLTGVFPGLALGPINNVLAEYGFMPLNVGLSGVLSGPGAWNATGMFVMMALAFAGGRWFVLRFTRLREIDVHTCGLPVETSTSRMKPSSIYGDILRLVGGEKTAKENR